MAGDQWVTNTQTWLNATYTGVSGWYPVEVNGRTSWDVMYALIRALQYELGITDLSDNFGAGTLAAVTAIGGVGPSTTNLNIVRITQGAMYCTGYNGGYGLLDGDYSSVTIDAAKELRQDIGLSAGDGSLAPKLVKALLTMNAYVLVEGGDPVVRQIQRDLNGRYLHREDFFVIPADGVYSRDVQYGLMLALQYEIGMADGVANGNFGPGTQAGLSSQANFGTGDSDLSSGKYFIHLFQAALIFNRYPTAYSGVFSAATTSIATAFQSFCLLTQSGRSDFQTWASLLVSTGDVNRPGKAADTIREITTARATTLITEGYETVGRYLTNMPGAGALDKRIKPGELATMFGAGFTVFPIFQEGGDDRSFFGYLHGVAAAQSAHDAAAGYRFLPGTVIYFAVDFDAFEWEVYDYVLPHFQGIRDGLGSRLSQYRVGIYGSRNTCSIVANAGLAELSFVSGMSTGYSGNLGFPLPVNWAFDQILEYEIGEDDGWVNIDKDIKSDRDLGQSAVATAPPPPPTDAELALAFIYRVQSLAYQYVQNTSDTVDAADLTARYLRIHNIGEFPQGFAWTVLGGSGVGDFFDYVDTEIPSNEVPAAFASSAPVDGVDWPHLMAVVSAYLYRGASTSQNGPQFADLGGWGGDVTTLAADFWYERQTDPLLDAYVYATDALTNDVQSSFSTEDLYADVYGWLAVFSYQTSETVTLADAVRAAAGNTTFAGENSFDSFVRLRLSSVSNGIDIINQTFEQPGDTNDRLLFNTYRTALLQTYLDGEPLLLSEDFSTSDLRAICKALGNHVAALSTLFSPLP